MDIVYYCVWWTEDNTSPDSQLIGICNNESDAEILVSRTVGYVEGGDKVYYTREGVDDKGEII